MLRNKLCLLLSLFMLAASAAAEVGAKGWVACLFAFRVRKTNKTISTMTTTMKMGATTIIVPPAVEKMENLPS